MMNLSNAIKDGTLSEKEGSEVINVIESFLVRRAVCGHEPTGLHAVFKKLWSDCSGKPTKDSVIKRIKEHKTVVWPKRTDFSNAIQKRSLYGAGITSYVVLEYDRSLKGDVADNVPWLEHVLPDNPVKDWDKFFNKQQHGTYKDLLANLIPLSEGMNRSLSNKVYSEKKKKYSNDSMFKSAREFAKEYRTWNPVNLEKRGKKLASWACRRWAY